MKKERGILGILIPIFMVVCMYTCKRIIQSPKHEAVVSPSEKGRDLKEQFIVYDTLVNLERATTYNAEVSQCDSDPFGTADGSRINPTKLKNQEIRWVALSRDLIWDEYRQGLYKHDFRGQFAFGDTIYLHSELKPQINGYWVVHDCMNKRYRNSIDFLFDSSNNKPKLGVGKDVQILKPTIMNEETTRFFTYFRKLGWTHTYKSKGYHTFCNPEGSREVTVWSDDNTCQIYGEGIETKMTISYPGGQWFSEISSNFVKLVRG